ncbi:TraB/GumN family protein [Methylotenera versatilis]|uniref:GumN family protein n=1 Tax=Methylotenera versatilis (strain 301) TaxID=666681 RepID=D7DIU5_METV0|nr:TraB/GumN family protein [Methylotenera versatilis]ADI29980.1 GumN family protein [Methylotenera versatilis 301]
MILQFKRLLSAFLTFGFLALANTNACAEQGLFWKVESPTGKTNYLFGTMHTDDNRVTNFSPAVDNALASVDEFMMETLAPNDRSVFMMPDGDLKNMLTESELDKVYALAEFHVMHRDAATHMKPWLLAVVFDSPKPLTPFAQDNLLMTKSEDLGKEVIGIEDTKEHFGVMDSFSRDEQLTMLRAVLKRSPEQKERDFESLMAAYLAGDSNKVAALDEKITGGMLPPALWAKMRSKLLDERNVVMAQRITEEAKNKSVFVAVGASHLAGKGGLIARLKDAGYKLSPIN